MNSFKFWLTFIYSKHIKSEKNVLQFILKSQQFSNYETIDFAELILLFQWHFCSLNQIAKLHLSSQICNILILQNYLFDKCYTIQLEFFKTIVSAMFNMLKNIFLLILFIYIHEYVHEINQLLEIYFSLNLKKDSYADRDKLLLKLTFHPLHMQILQ